VILPRVLALHQSHASPLNPPFTGLTQEADWLAREVEAVDRSIDGFLV
jgi:hypothetical protein